MYKFWRGGVKTGLPLKQKQKKPPTKRRQKKGKKTVKVVKKNKEKKVSGSGRQPSPTNSRLPVCRRGR
jgi:hypothetical protein